MHHLLLQGAGGQGHIIQGTGHGIDVGRIRASHVDHNRGLNLPTQNDVHDFVRRGAVVYSDNNVELTRFYGSDLVAEMTLYNQGYANIVWAACGLEPEEPVSVVAESFKRAIDRYRAPLDLLATAKELGVPPDAWKSEIETEGVGLSARVVGLNHGRTIARDSWEEQYIPCKILAKE